MLSIFMAHNYYRSFSPSGENVAFEAEAELLRTRGHAVHLHVRRSDEIAAFSLTEHARLGARIVWSKESYVEIKRELAEHRPDVAHFHNTFPLISVSAFQACRELKVPVVHTLWNYRPLCLNAQLLRAGKVCESCVDKRLPWPGILHRCYRSSASYSASMAAMQFLHRTAYTGWADVNVFIAPSQFVRQKYVSAGFPINRIVVKPHFATPDTSVNDRDREYALFVGRLSTEKGVHTLLAAWKQLPHIPLIILGEGPQGAEVRTAASRLKNVTMVGSVGHSEVLGYLRRARYLVMPSEWYEPFGIVLVEALACGTPVIASNLGGIPETIVDGRTGLLFKPKDPCDLARKAEYLWSHPEHARTLGREARLAYEARFTPEKNYEELLGVYALALGKSA
jgi:glycosyltransferase involved in cell wall biosynthesis